MVPAARAEAPSYDSFVFGVVTLVALGIVIGDLLRRARQRRELEDSWLRENEKFLNDLRKSR